MLTSRIQLWLKQYFRLELCRPPPNSGLGKLSHCHYTSVVRRSVSSVQLDKGGRLAYYRPILDCRQSTKNLTIYAYS